MKYYYLGFILAIFFGIYSTYLFLKASSLYAQYRDSVKRRTRGDSVLKSWRFILPLKAFKGESNKMRQNRRMHETYLKRYYVMMTMIVILLIISASSAKY